MSGDSFEIEGEVILSLPNALFRVKLDNGSIILCHISGKIRKHSINILPGDRVTVEVSSYDITKGRITYRTRGKKEVKKNDKG